VDKSIWRDVIRARAGRAIGYSTGFGVASLVANIALLPLIFSTVGAGPYGVWLFLVTIVQYFYYADLGVGAAVLHFSARTRGGDTSKTMEGLLSTALAWSVLACVVSVPAYTLVSSAYLRRDSVASVIPSGTSVSLLVLTAFALGVIALRPFNSILIGAGGFVMDRKFQFLGLAIRIIGTLWACLAFESLLGVAIVETIALTVPTIGATVYVLYKRIIIPRISGMSVDLWREMTSYSIRSIASTLASLAAIQGGTVVIGLIGSPSDVSYYNAALRIYVGIRNVGQWCTSPFQTTLSRTYVESRSKAESVVRSATFGTLLLVSGASVCVILVSEWLIGVWLGREVPTSEIAHTTTILLVGLVLFSLHGPLSMASAASGRPGLFFPLQLAWAVTAAALGAVLGARYGIVGIALGMTLPLIVIEPLYIVVAVRVLNMDFRLWIQQCIAPVVALIGTATMIGVIVSKLDESIARNKTLSAFTTLGAVAISVFVVAYVARRWLPWKQFRMALSEEV
jgi:O-antigen/teichoic acid export membrane protein